MHYFHITLLVLYLNVIHASIYGQLKDNVQSLVDDLRGIKDIPIRRDNDMRYFHSKKHEDTKDKKSARDKAKVLQSVRTHEQHLNSGRDMPSSKFTGDHSKLGKEYYHMDPVLNELRHRRFGIQRRKSKYSSSSSQTSSSSSEEQFWKDRWSEQWMQKKFEALNSTQPRGDVVNMAAARPWGVPCGDPNQHDMPWGNCMLAPECDAEYRIFRGDYFCGRTAYVCCALLVTNYDMYQGLDMSFEGTSFETDSNEKNRENNKKNKKKKERSRKRKRKRARDKRKRKIKKSIRKIVKEIRRILSKAYRNGTAQRKKKTKELKRFIKLMKKQYRKDRKSVVNVHEYELIKIDQKLQSKLNKIKGVNEKYMANDTYRGIVVNGTVNRARLRDFIRANPDFADVFKHRRTGLNLKPEIVKLKSTLESEEPKSEIEKPKSEVKVPKLVKRKPRLHDYDVEYGMLYY